MPISLLQNIFKILALIYSIKLLVAVFSYLEIDTIPSFRKVN